MSIAASTLTLNSATVDDTSTDSMPCVLPFVCLIVMVAMALVGCYTHKHSLVGCVQAREEINLLSDDFPLESV
jgi:hypothetical protein